MILLTLLRATKGGKVKTVALILFVVFIIFLILWQIIWSYHHFESALGKPMAEVAIAYHVAFLVGMLVVGVVLGHVVDRMIKGKKSIFALPAKGGKTELFMQLWGYELHEEEELPTELESVTIVNSPRIETSALSNIQTTSRRGRKPTFTVDRWVPIAAKWEHRDPIRDAFTLGELIAEYLGTNSDGSPIVSEQTYYSVWRKRALEEIQRRAECKQAISRAKENQH